MLEKIAATPISELERHAPVQVTADAALADVVRLMREQGRGEVIVHDGSGRFAGIFTEGDLMNRTSSEEGWERKRVGEVMSTTAHGVSPSATISDVLRLMHEKTCRRLPVLDVEGNVVGIVTVRDVLRHVADAFPEEFINLPPDPSREASDQWGG